MNSREVSKEIKEQVKPWLKEQGFQKITARNAWRTNENTIEVINFESFNSYNAGVMGVTTFSFAVNLGIYYKFLNICPWSNYEVLTEPKYHECHATRSVLKSIRQPETKNEAVWFINKDGSNLTAAVADSKSQISNLAPNWFVEFSNLEEALNIFQNRPESYSDSAGLYECLGGRGFSLSRAEIISAIAIKTGNIDKAINFWINLSKSEFYQKYPVVIKEAVDKIEQLKKII